MSEKSNPATSCRTCGGELEPFLPFGRMPLANGFLEPAHFATEYHYDLAVGACGRCSMVQLIEQPSRELMFNDSYPFFSSTSERMRDHFGRLARDVLHRFLPAESPFVVELGSNDGILLRHFADVGIRHLGIEPSANVAGVARARGVRTLVAFFDPKVAQAVHAEHGPAHALLAANVMCHIPDLHSVAQGASVLLAPDGVLVFEEPYWADIVANTAYDQIYDEHIFYFSVASAGALFAMHGFEIVDCERQEVHGGSMRYTVARKGRRAVNPRVAEALARENAGGLHASETRRRFRERVEHSREALASLLRSVRREGRRVVGYGATSKSTTVINYCGITPDLVEFISDTTPEKQGKYSPGAHIPVRAHAEFAARHPDYALLFAWNHAREIMAKEAPFAGSGGRWIVYVPEVGIA